MTALELRVVYPRPSGSKLVLRTEKDWNQDVQPSGTSADGTVATFKVSTERPFLYFKPCLITGDGQFHWSVGSNYLALNAPPGVRDLYPHFFGSMNGEITERLTAPEADGGRLYRVYLPPGYRENTLKKYPVLYMHDGANLFFPDEAFQGQDWEVSTTLELLDSMNILDRVIVVGVYAEDRKNEYTTPGYEAYGKMLTGSLKPLVDRSYRTLNTPASTAVMGSSLGGVVSMYLAWQYPDVFGKAACLSSTFGYKDDLFKRVRTEPRRALQLYIDTGWPGDNFEENLTMRDLLIERGWKPGTDLLYFAFPYAQHNEAAWSMRIHIPFQFFFSKLPSMPAKS
ncbi:MAG TPA: alpha/beta hydrolase-fold protein [Myxococcales bacterium]|nr:alpha/beta hydrolase-fold protein [Myxococcales bacterium]